MSLINQSTTVCMWCHISRAPAVLLSVTANKQSDSGRLGWTQSWGAPLLISAPGKILKMSATTLVCIKSQVILSPALRSNKSHLELSIFPSVYPSPSRPAEDWWRDAGKNQCFPASCVMFRDGWCGDGSFSCIAVATASHPSEWKKHVDEALIHSIYFPSFPLWPDFILIFLLYSVGQQVVDESQCSLR